MAAGAGGGFDAPRVGRGLAVGDFDRDGDVDVLMTTNNGPAVLFRNDQAAGRRSLRLTLTGTKSNRDAIGAVVRVFHGGTSQSRMVKSGSSYLSQSELPVTFGVGARDVVERVVITLAERRDPGVQERRSRPRIPLRRRAADTHRLMRTRTKPMAKVFAGFASISLFQSAACSKPV